MDFCVSRFNCGTGAAQIVSESRIVPGRWHTVTIFRDGMSGWLRMDNDTPISGRSQVTVRQKITGFTFVLLLYAHVSITKNGYVIFYLRNVCI